MNVRPKPLLAGMIAAGLALALSTGPAPGTEGAPSFTPGAPGAGDPYFPLDGNGGYDVRHYFLDVKYTPATDVLDGLAVIRARATQNLSQFNLDLEGLRVQWVVVNGNLVRWSRDGGELTVWPRQGLPEHSRFTVVIRYRGVPETLDDFGGSGFIHTDDGTLVIGEPHVADTWYPVNDHPSDKASYTFRITVPRGLEAIANGRLVDSASRAGHTSWIWHAKEPMASYLTTATIGEFDLRTYRASGVRFWDALDPDLYEVAEPRTGDRLAISQVVSEGASYKRLARTFDVPAGGAKLSAWINRSTELSWDYVVVEAHTVGQNDWTTLPDLNGHTSRDTGFSCPYWLQLHPFLRHYQTRSGDTCAPTGTTGRWHAASGSSDGYELWRVDLGGFAGSEVEVAISYVSDDVVQGLGVFVDDVTGPGGQGSTSFEDDGNILDGWTVPGPPPGSAPNENDWITGTVADLPPSTGESVDASFDRHGEILSFLAESFGPYPFSAAGGIVDDAEGIGFALENQTRPIYSRGFFGSPGEGDGVVVHELAHQWYGDSLAVKRWRHIWLNEGFATYAEWLWSEDQGLGTAQEIFDFFYTVIPEDDPFWQVIVGNPGPDSLFDFAIYARGAMTLHQLRLAVGEADFHSILTAWSRRHQGGNVTTGQFVALSERISGQPLDDLFQTWLFTPGRPTVVASASLAAGSTLAPQAVRDLVTRHDAKELLTQR